MAHTFINPTVVAKEAIMQLKNNCVMGGLVYRGYEQQWSKTYEGWKPGSSITIKAPMYARVKDGATIDIVDFLEQSTTMTLSYRKHVAHRLTSEEMTYSIDKFSERIIQPAMVAIANYIDGILLGLYKQTANQVGTPGVTPQSFLPFALAAARLDDHSVPRDNRYLIINPTCQAYLSDHFKGMFVSEIAANAVKQSKINMPVAGFTPYVSQNVQNHTCGTAAGLTTPLKYGTSAEDDDHIDIDTNGSWTLTLTEGDIFTVADTYAVNPVSGSQLGYLRQFVAQVHTDNGTDGTVTTYPGLAPFPIRSASATETKLPYQTVSGIPTDNKAIAISGSASLVHPVNLAFHKNAFALAMVPLEMPPSVSWKSQMTEDGYSVRVIRDYDIVNDFEYVRFDVLFGIKALNPFMACRIAG